MTDKYEKKNYHHPLVARKSQNIVKENAQRIYSAPGGFKYAIAWIAYVLLGSWVFLVLEKKTTHLSIKHEKWIRFKDLYMSGEGADELENIKIHLLKLCPHQLFNSSFENSTTGSADIIDIASSSSEHGANGSYSQFASMHTTFDEVEKICESTLLTLQKITKFPDWTMVDAIYYTMTLVTTIGFGHISPTTDKGKIFCILYALVGIPLTCILMARNSNWLSTKMVVVYQSAKKRWQINEKTVLGIVTWMFISLGFIVFVFIPSTIFFYIEEWSFVECIYFTFTTLTTIGFGDLIAGYNDVTKYSSFYKLSIVVWIMFALGYWVMCLSFLQKAIKQNAKTLRKTFRRKTIAKHTDVIRQLMSKLKSEPEESAEATAQRVHMMAILVESLMKRNSVDYSHSYAHMGNDGNGIPKKPSMIRKPIEMDDTIDIEKEQTRVVSSGSSIEVSFTLDDLLNATIVLQKDSLPGIESMVSRVSNDFHAHFPSTSSSESTSNNNQDASSINLTVREVMGLSLLLSSVSNGSESMDTDSPSEYSDTLTAVVVHPRENMPLLKDILRLEADQNEDFKKSLSPKLEKSFFIDSQVSLSDANEKTSYRQYEVATG